MTDSEPEIVSVEQMKLSWNKRKRLIKSPSLIHVVRRSCRNCGWKIKGPMVVNLFGFDRVDNKIRANGGKWCVVWAKKPVKCPCGEWVEYNV
jgi:hypothetical protein